MSSPNIIEHLTKTIEELSTEESMKGIFHEHRDGDPLPSGRELEEIIDLSRSVLFPGYYGDSNVNQNTISYHIGVNMERLHKLLTRQIMAGLLFNQDCHCAQPLEEQSLCSIAEKLLGQLRCRGCFRRRSGSNQRGRGHQLLPCHQGADKLPHSPRALP